MNKLFVSMAAGCAVSLVALTGCEWSSTGEEGSFNTSRGAGISMNFSGHYKGELSGGRAVAATSAGNITSFTIAQTGNDISVVDNQGSKYTGSVGSPGLIADAESGIYPSGAEIVQGQINFSGHDNVSGRNIQFSGIIHVVTVTDVQGNTSTETDTSTDTDTNTQSTDNQVTDVETSVVRGEDTTTTTTVTTIGTPGSVFYQVITDVVVTENSTGREISNTTTTSGSSTQTQTQNQNQTQTQYTVFEITDANAQYRLQGTWIEEAGVVSQVQARSPGALGTITSTTTTTDTTTTDTTTDTGTDTE